VDDPVRPAMDPEDPVSGTGNSGYGGVNHFDCAWRSPRQNRLVGGTFPEHVFESRVVFQGHDCFSEPRGLTRTGTGHSKALVLSPLADRSGLPSRKRHDLC
jgi:hypothetical protein